MFYNLAGLTTAIFLFTSGLSAQDSLSLRDGHTATTTRTPQSIPDKDFQSMLQLIQRENFENGKLDVAKMFFGTTTQGLSTAQVIGVLKLFALDDKKLLFAKFVYTRTRDKRNYYKVLETFDTSEAKKDLSAFLDKR